MISDQPVIMQLVGGAPTDVSVINARKYHLAYAALGRGELSNEDVLSQLTAKRAHQMPLATTTAPSRSTCHASSPPTAS